MGITFRLLSHLTTLLGVEAVNDCIDLRSARLECVVWQAYLSLDALADIAVGELTCHIGLGSTGGERRVPWVTFEALG